VTGGGCASAVASADYLQTRSPWAFRKKRELIAGLFWLGVTAARLAKKAGFHPNTVAKYYRHIRKYIAAEREAGLDKFKLDSIVYSDGWKAYHKLSFNGFHHRRIKHDKTRVDGKQRPR
jgi:transposase-like protein